MKLNKILEGLEVKETVNDLDLDIQTYIQTQEKLNKADYLLQ